MLVVNRLASLKGLSVFLLLAAGCGGPLADRDSHRSDPSAEADDEAVEDEGEGLGLVQGALSKQAKKLLKKFVKQIKVIDSHERKAQKAEEKLQTECDDYDNLKAQFSALKSIETTEPYKALDVLDDASDRLWLFKKGLREKKHAMVLDTVTNAPGFQELTKGELRCIRSEARREFVAARKRASQDQKNARMRGEILLKALDARIPYAAPGANRDKSLCTNRYLALRARITDAAVAPLAADVDAIESQKHAVKEAQVALRKAVRASGVDLPSDKDLEISANNACSEPEYDSDYYL